MQVFRFVKGFRVSVTIDENRVMLGIKMTLEGNNGPYNLLLRFG